jgi:6-pyruvoyltetrahydropterin/6-carboxytetrahydropterin synthase
MARWICEQIPQCFRVEVQESEGNVAIYEKD